MSPTPVNNTVQNTAQEAINQVESLGVLQLPDFLRNFFTETYWSTLTDPQKELLINIDSLPSHLFGIVPDSVWGTLSLEQKLEFLFQNSIIPKPEHGVDTAALSPENGFDGPMGTVLDQNKVEVATPQIESDQPVEASQEFVNAVEQVQMVEQSHQAEIAQLDSDQDKPLDAAEKAQIEVETAAHLNTLSSPKFTAGYSPSGQIVNDIDRYANGDVVKASTWSASLVRKIWDALSAA